MTPNYVDQLIAQTPKAVAKQEDIWGRNAGIAKFAGAEEALLSVIPFPWWMPESLRRAFIRVAINLCVKALNWAWGKVWNSQNIKALLMEGN